MPGRSASQSASAAALADAARIRSGSVSRPRSASQQSNGLDDRPHTAAVRLISANWSPRPQTAPWRDELTVLAPAALVLALVSAETGFNHHLRYILPIFPFAFVWMSKAARAFERKNRVAAVLAGSAVAWAVASSLWVYPHSLSYFNELVGGPENGSEHLVDSNIDWGQDLLYLRDWLKEHPEARPLGLAYFGYFDPRVAGIEFTMPPPGPTSPEEASGPNARELGPRPGWYAVSVTMLRGYQYHLFDGCGGEKSFALNSFAYFLRFRLVGRAGWSIYIYHITPEECRQARREMGLPALDGPADAPDAKD